MCQMSFCLFFRFTGTSRSSFWSHPKGKSSQKPSSTPVHSGSSQTEGIWGENHIIVAQQTDRSNWNLLPFPRLRVKRLRITANFTYWRTYGPLSTTTGQKSLETSCTREWSVPIRWGSNSVKAFPQELRSSFTSPSFLILRNHKNSSAETWTLIFVNELKLSQV